MSGVNKRWISFIFSAVNRHTDIYFVKHTFISSEDPNTDVTKV